MGWFRGEATGAFDAETAAALRHFRFAAGLDVTGAVDGNTQVALVAEGEEWIYVERDGLTGYLRRDFTVI